MDFKKVVLLYFTLILFSSFLICCHSKLHPQKTEFLGSRKLLQLDEKEEELMLPGKKIQTNFIKPKTNSTQKSPSTPNLIKKLNSTLKSSNSTLKSSSSTPSLISSKPQLKKLNSTAKSSNSTKPNSILVMKSSSSNLLKSKNKTSNPISTKQSNSTKSQLIKKDTITISQKSSLPTIGLDGVDVDDDGDLVAEIRDLPTNFQKTLLPDLEKISKTSKVYLNKANKEITNGFIKPIFGKKYAPTIATILSCAFILLPLFIVSLLINHFKSYFSLQKILIFIQIYLSIYFSILCFSSLITGIEPLRFFYSTSQYTYVWLQVLQTLGYVLYLLLLLMYLILVFSTDCGLGSKLLGLAQVFVGFAVGLHYYVTVFHKVVLHQPPKTNWKIHGMYATCFFVICLLARAERRKKAYVEEGGEEGKKS